MAQNPAKNQFHHSYGSLILWFSGIDALPRVFDPKLWRLYIPPNVFYK
jgi:hypothetical protein